MSVNEPIMARTYSNSIIQITDSAKECQPVGKR